MSTQQAKYTAAYQDRKKIGKSPDLCSVPACTNPRDGAHKKCAQCLEYMRNYKKIYRSREKDPTLCSRADCKNPVEEGYKMCSHCRQVFSAAQRRDVEYNAKHKIITDRQRDQVFDYYGRSCACCGEDRQEFLSIDHVNGDGARHRTPSGYRMGSHALYRWLIQNDFPEGFRTLCFNCNFALGHFGYCPHSDLEQEAHVGRYRTKVGGVPQLGNLQRKLKVFEAYGGCRCACCGEENHECLSVDHINEDGSAHREEISGKKKGSGNLYLWLIRNNFPPGYQVLCFNCNWGKHRNGGICPHQDPS